MVWIHIALTSISLMPQLMERSGNLYEEPSLEGQHVHRVQSDWVELLTASAVGIDFAPSPKVCLEFTFRWKSGVVLLVCSKCPTVDLEVAIPLVPNAESLQSVLLFSSQCRSGYSRRVYMLISPDLTFHVMRGIVVRVLVLEVTSRRFEFRQELDSYLGCYKVKVVDGV